jgi:hypothetical protein
MTEKNGTALACSGASVDERLDALHSLTRRALAKRTDGGVYAATAYHLAARRLRQNVAGQTLATEREKT